MSHDSQLPCWKLPMDRFEMISMVAIRITMILFAYLLTAFCSISSCSGGVLDSLDNYLAGKPGDAEALMALATDWLNSNQANRSFVSLSRSSAVNAAEMFKELKRIRDDVKSCGSDGYRVLSKANRTTTGRTPNSLFKQTTTLISVAKIVDYCALEHAKFCRDNKGYLATFEDKLKRLDGDKLHRVQTVMNEFVKRALPGAEKFPIATDNEKYKSFLDDGYQRGNLYRRIILRKTDAGLSPADYDTLFEGIKHLATEAVRNKFLTKVVSDIIIHKGEVKELFNLYVIEPCRHFVNTLGEEVFTPAQYNADLLAESNGFISNSPDLSEFYLYWSHFKLCSNILHQKSGPVLDILAKVAVERRSDIKSVVTGRIGLMTGARFQ